MKVYFLTAASEAYSWNDYKEWEDAAEQDIDRYPA